ncbi:hypothetical protein HPP92_021409 [Vanilla planifolia]|uniref:Uncharacterized protein n=1 Tax=Vanilla planifolia TaxID=51239 RepID=A0A835Q5J8_VANPL|nr:hypothetical protein HPP92_021409 [Vanilla planifolia]
MVKDGATGYRTDHVQISDAGDPPDLSLDYDSVERSGIIASETSARLIRWVLSSGPDNLTVFNVKWGTTFSRIWDLV